MNSLLQRPIPGLGALLFRGTLPPRPEELVRLSRAGISVERVTPHPDHHWRLLLHHSQWGAAALTAPKHWRMPPPFVIRFSSELTSEEKVELQSARQALLMDVPGTRKNVLQDRKHLLRYASLILGDDGVSFQDGSSLIFWSRSRLDDELAHDSDLDVESLYGVHAVTDSNEALSDSNREEESATRVQWLHTHGLAQIGAFDFDILRPAPSLLLEARDALRAIAFAIIEGVVKPDTPSWKLASHGGTVAFVSAKLFDRSAPKEERQLRTGEDHSDDRAVLCEPAGRLDRLLGRGVRCSRFLSNGVDENVVLKFSSSATNLMRERARGTFSLFCALIDEFQDVGIAGYVKLGLDTDGDRSDEHEHLWFEFHSVQGNFIDGTLINTPLSIARLAHGQRSRHLLERLSDWFIPTPVGNITPRSLTAARVMRAIVPEIRRQGQVATPPPLDPA
jgi:uncharacterized protein YegJ (DUF2314 family)